MTSRWLVLVLLGFALPGLASCSAAAPGGPQSPGNGQPSTEASQVVPSTSESAKLAAAKLMLTDLDLADWKLAAKAPKDLFSQWVCGVSVDPGTSDGLYHSIFQNSKTTYLAYQTTRPVGADAAQGVLDDLSKSLKTCRKDVRAQGSTKAYFDITPLKPTSPNVVAFRQRETGVKTEARTDWALFRVGDTLVAFLVMSDASQPQTAELDALVAAIRAKA